MKLNQIVVFPHLYMNSYTHAQTHIHVNASELCKKIKQKAGDGTNMVNPPEYRSSVWHLSSTPLYGIE